MNWAKPGRARPHKDQTESAINSDDEPHRGLTSSESSHISDPTPVPLHLLYEETGASLWSFALWEEYCIRHLFTTVYLPCSIQLCLVFSYFQGCFLSCKEVDWRSRFSSHLKSHLRLVAISCYFFKIWLMSISTPMNQTMDIWGSACQKRWYNMTSVSQKTLVSCRILVTLLNWLVVSSSKN